MKNKRILRSIHQFDIISKCTQKEQKRLTQTLSSQSNALSLQIGTHT